MARCTLLRETPTRHLLLFTAHHLVFDGMSKDLLLDDLAAAYRGTDLPPLPDLAAAEPGEQAVQAARAYWAEHWTGAGEPVLPDLTGAPAAAEPGHTVELTMPPVDVGGLTRFEVLLAAIHVLLARYGNTGMPVAVGLSTRDEDTAARIGLHVNELPIGVAPARGRFRDYAHDLRSRLRELYRHRTVPLAQVVGGLRAAPSLTAVSVGYRRRGPAPAFPGLPTDVLWSLFHGAARNALHIQIVDGPDGDLAVSLQHSPAHLPTAAAHRIGQHLRTVLAAVAADPDTDVATMAVMPAAELATVLHGWNDTAREQRGTVAQLFATQARLRPDDIAVVDGDHRLTYAELDHAAAELATRLPGPGALIAIRLPRGRQALVAMLAVMRAGSAYVPVDPAYPAARQELILADAQPALILDDLAAVPAASPGGEVPAGTAYVMYTSGTTGRPKGVVVPHTALANLLLGMAETVGSRPGDRWLGLTPLSFDISGLELFLPLVTGGRLVIAGEAGGLDGRAVNALVEHEGVTHVQATPSGWQVLLEAGFDGRATVTALAGGENLPSTWPGGCAPGCPGSSTCTAPPRPPSGRPPRTSPPIPTPSPSAARSPTPASTCSTTPETHCPSAYGASCASAATASPTATCAAPTSPSSASAPTPSAAGGSTAPATGAAGRPTAASPSAAAPTARSRCAGTASSWRRSKPTCASTPRSPKPPSHCAAANWPPTSCPAATPSTPPTCAATSRPSCPRPRCRPRGRC
ncbi:AMP-binding protein [Catellatospora coxensis]